ncbi:nucleic-acid-binding protein from transposon X-element [Trichonephila clavipes]|nr:nucleic-acid-binding protein from transposon X-element [Trichonephila clavipes]
MEVSPNSRSNSSSRSSTPKPEKPLTDCEIRRNAMERLNHQKTMIAGYKNFLNNPMTLKDVSICKEMEKHLQITIQAREKLKRRKNTKSNSDDFVFPSKTARPTTPTKVLEPVEVQNSYDNLDEDPEINVTETNDKPAPSPPQPIFLKIKDNYRDQLNKIMKKFPNVKSKSSGKHIKLNTDCHIEHQEIIDFMDEDRDIEFYVFKPKETKPIKVVVKGLPGCTKPNEIVSDLEDQGCTVTSANQLISKRTKLELPFFLITMPRNEFNLTVFDLTHLGYMQVRIEGYSVHGITQCFNCNNFYHTAHRQLSHDYKMFKMRQRTPNKRLRY